MEALSDSEELRHREVERSLHLKRGRGPSDDRVQAAAQKRICRQASGSLGLELVGSSYQGSVVFNELAKRLSGDRRLGITINPLFICHWLGRISCNAEEYEDSPLQSLFASEGIDIRVRRRYAREMISKVQPAIYRHLPDEIKNCEWICSEAFARDKRLLSDFPRGSISRKRVIGFLQDFPQLYSQLPDFARSVSWVLPAVFDCYDLLKHIQDKDEQEQILRRIKASNVKIFTSLLHHYKYDRELVPVFLKIAPHMLKGLVLDDDLTSALKADYIFSQLDSNVDAFALLPKAFLHDRKNQVYIQKCILRNYQVLQFLSAEDAHHYLFFAVSYNVDALSLIDQSKQIYRENLARIVVRIPDARPYVSRALMDDTRFALKVLDVQPSLYKELWPNNRDVSLVFAQRACVEDPKYKENSMMEGKFYLYSGIPEELRVRSRGGVAVKSVDWQQFVDVGLHNFISELSYEELSDIDCEQIGFYYTNIEDYESEEAFYTAIRSHLEEMRASLSTRMKSESPYIGTPKGGEELRLFYQQIKKYIGILGAHYDEGMKLEKLDFLMACTRCGAAWLGECVTMANAVTKGEPDGIHMMVGHELAIAAESYCEEERLGHMEEEEEDAHIWSHRRYFLEQFLLGHTTVFDALGADSFSGKEFYVAFIKEYSARVLIDRLLDKMRKESAFAELFYDYVCENMFNEFRRSVSVEERQKHWHSHKKEIKGSLRSFSKESQRELDRLLSRVPEEKREKMVSMLRVTGMQEALFIKLATELVKDESLAREFYERKDDFFAHLLNRANLVALLKVDVTRLMSSDDPLSLYRRRKEDLKTQFAYDYDMEMFRSSIVHEGTRILKGSVIANALVRMGFFSIFA